MYCPKCHRLMTPAKSEKGTVCHKCKVAVTATWIRIGLAPKEPERPRDCFGLKHEEDKKKCQICPFEYDCEKSKGKRYS